MDEFNWKVPVEFIYYINLIYDNHSGRKEKK